MRVQVVHHQGDMLHRLLEQNDYSGPPPCFSLVDGLIPAPVSDSVNYLRRWNIRLRYLSKYMSEAIRWPFP